MIDKIMLTLFILLGTIAEIALLWDPRILSDDFLKYIIGIFVVLDMIALIRILMEI
jgi:hypothetical protein